MKNVFTYSKKYYLLALLYSFILTTGAIAQDDIADVSSQKHQLKNKLTYYTIGDEKAEPPKNGYKILVVLPGGDGSVNFQPFIKRIYKNCLSEDYLMIQLIARKWSRRQYVVWPTKKLKVKGMRTSTEDFITLAVNDLKKRTKIDNRHVTVIGWSSSGPSIYTAALTKKSLVTGSFIAMSVFKPKLLPALSNGKGRNFFIFHSRQDRVCPFQMADAANKQLTKIGANVNFVEYTGGHGWHGNVFGNITEGITWLENQNSKSSSEEIPEDENR